MLDANEMCSGGLMMILIEGVLAAHLGLQGNRARQGRPGAPRLKAATKLITVFSFGTGG